MQEPLVSIIVPIYKVEPYLQRCIDSIVSQTYTNLEIILVDDGSPDGCPQICDEYAAKDNRIVVIHKENGGLSDARNAGLDICKGEYVSFVDSDDWIADSFIENLAKAIYQSNADIGVADFIRTSLPFTAKVQLESSPHLEELNSLQSVKKLWTKDYVTFVIACAKIYKASLFAGIRFPKGKIHEDEYTTYKLLYRASKTVFLNAPLYFYFQRDDSIMGKVAPCSVRALKAYVERYQFFRKNDNEIANLCLSTLCWDLLFAYGQSKQGKIIQGFSDPNEIFNIFRRCQKDYCKANFPFFTKIFFKFITFFPSLYIIYQKFSPFKLRKT